MLKNNTSSAGIRRKPLNYARLQRRVFGYVSRFLTSRARLESFVWRQIKRWEDAGAEVEVTQDDCLKLIEDCVKRGYVDDFRFAEMRITRWYRGGQSQRAIYQKLRAESISDEVIEQALSAFFKAHGEAENPQELDYEAAMHYARKRRIGPYRQQDREAWSVKDMAKLGRRGFSYDIAYQVVHARLTGLYKLH